ncbi:MAG TPA: hypothetical protein VGM33_03335 [Baekduia sp.]|jgi:hypothetical protein
MLVALAVLVLVAAVAAGAGRTATRRYLGGRRRPLAMVESKRRRS